MSRTPAKRPGSAEWKRAVNASLSFYNIPLRNEVGPKRVRKPRGTASGVPLERDVLKQIIRALRADPRVAMVERNQSGLFQDGNRYIRVGSRGKLDLTVLLTSGRYAEIEVKRPGRKPDPHQLERIEAIRKNGGIAGYATSPEQALELLPC